jgi:hypothetical protein
MRKLAIFLAFQAIIPVFLGTYLGIYWNISGNCRQDIIKESSVRWSDKIWSDIDTEYRYGTSDINKTSIGISI